MSYTTLVRAVAANDRHQYHWPGHSYEPAVAAVDRAQGRDHQYQLGGGDLPLSRRQCLCRVQGVRAAIFTGLALRSEEHTSELQSLMRISYAVFCLQKKLTKK